MAKKVFKGNLAYKAFISHSVVGPGQGSLGIARGAVEVLRVRPLPKQIKCESAVRRKLLEIYDNERNG